MKEYEEGTSEYTVTSKTGCVAVNLMPRKVLNDLILELTKISNKRREGEITVVPSKGKK